MFGKIEFGDYQTPEDFSDIICQFLANEGINPQVIIEPTCGIGNFIRSSLKYFSAEDIIGIDINSIYCSDCSHNFPNPPVRIFNADIFNFNFSHIEQDRNILILGNPPWATNSKLSSIDSLNLPEKSNFKKFKGFDAITGASNFDICEYIILKLIDSFKSQNFALAMLCKTSVARNVFLELSTKQIPISKFNIYEFDAKKVFGINAAACLLFITSSTLNDYVPSSFDVFNLDNPDKKTATISYYNGKLNISKKSDVNDFDGICQFTWRQGIKHDCSKVMELKKTDSLYINGYGKEVNIENQYIFPLIKSSMFKHPVISKFSRFVIVPQRKIGEDTTILQKDAPKLWNYLKSYEADFEKRKSSIYLNSPRFSIFGIGDYSFSSFKVGVSGFYKRPIFSLLTQEKDQPIMVDDTSYFICFESYDDAYVAMLYLNSESVQNFLTSIAFLDSKRPYTKKVLSRIDFKKVVHVVTFNELCSTEKQLSLKSYVTKDKIEAFERRYIKADSLF